MSNIDREENKKAVGCKTSHKERNKKTHESDVLYTKHNKKAIINTKNEGSDAPQKTEHPKNLTES